MQAGYSEVSFRCGNEPSLLQLQRYVINARLSMGLPTLKASPPPYSHSNGLVENVVGRIRPLAGSLMHYMSEQVGVDFSSNSPWWSWALRHASWLSNRFGPTKGMSPYELINERSTLERFAGLEKLSLVMPKWREKQQHVGAEWFSIPTFCMMGVVWF